MGEEMSPPSHLKVICTTQGSSYKLNYTNIRGKLKLTLQMSSRSGFKLGRRGEMSDRTFGPHPPNQHIRLGYFFFIYNMLGWVTGQKLWADFTWCIGRLGCLFIKSKSRLSVFHFSRWVANTLLKLFWVRPFFFPNITNYIMATEQKLVQEHGLCAIDLHLTPSRIWQTHTIYDLSLGHVHNPTRLCSTVEVVRECEAQRRQGI